MVNQWENVLEKVRALQQVLQERQGNLDDQRTFIEALVDFIETICPNPSRFWLIMRSRIATLSQALAQVPAAVSPPPSPTPSTSLEDSPPSSEIPSPGYGDGPTVDNNDASEMTVGTGQGQPGSDFDAMLLDLQPDPATGSPQIHNYSSSELLEILGILGQGFDLLPGFEDGAGCSQDITDTLPNHRLPSVPPSSVWPMDAEGDINVITQAGLSPLGTDMDTYLLSIFGTTDTRESQLLLSPHLLSPDRHQAVNGENVAAQPESRPPAATGMDMVELFFPLDIADKSPDNTLTSLPGRPVACQLPMNDTRDMNATAQHGLSPAHSALGMDVALVSDLDSGITSDNSQDVLHSSPPTTTGIASPMSPTTQALEDIRIAVENGDLQRLPLDRVSPTAQFQFPWGNLDGSTVQSLFRQFSCDGSDIGNDAIDYLCRKLASSELWIGQWSQRDQVPLCRRGLFTLYCDTTWSLIEVQLETHTITHYIFSPLDSTSLRGHEFCSYCQGIVTAIGQIPGRNTRSSDWHFIVETIANQPGGDGLCVSWIICSLAKGRTLQWPVPTDHRQSLAKGLIADLKAIRSSLLVLQRPPSVIRSTSADRPALTLEYLQDFWIKFGNEHGYGSRLSEKMHQLMRAPGNKDKYGACKLLQMALSIASPESLLIAKDCIQKVRSLVASECHSFPESARGTIEASRCHSNSGDLSTIGTRIGAWKVHMLRREFADDLEEEILQNEPEKSKEKVREWVQLELNRAKKGAYWSHLVEHAANRNPNILCLVPHTARMGPIPAGFTTTHYRDLPVPDCKLLGELIEEFRPGVITSIDASLSRVLFYIKKPSSSYLLEDVSMDDIKGEKLSSPFFREALALR